MRISNHRRKRRSDGARSFGGMGGASFGRSVSPSMRKPVRLIRDSNGNLLLDENPSQRTGGLNMSQFSDYNALINDVKAAADVTNGGSKQKAIKYLQQYAATYDLPQEDVRFILRQAEVASGYRKRVIEHLNDQLCNEDFQKWVAGKDPIDINSDNWQEFKGKLISEYLADQVNRALVAKQDKPLTGSQRKKAQKQIENSLIFATTGLCKLGTTAKEALKFTGTKGIAITLTDPLNNKWNGDFEFISVYIDNILNQCLEDYLGSSAMGYSGSLDAYSEEIADGRRRRRSKRSRKSRRKSRRSRKSKSLDGRRKKRRSHKSKSKSKSRRKSRRSHKSKSHDGRRKRRSHKSKKRSRRSKRRSKRSHKSKSHDGKRRSHKSHKKSRKSHKKSQKSMMEIMVLDGKRRRKSKRRSKKSKSCTHAMSDGKKRRRSRRSKSRSRRSKRSRGSRRSRRSGRKHRKMSKSLKKALMKLL